MTTSCPVCGTSLHPDEHAVATVAGHLVHDGACAATLAAALHDQQHEVAQW